MKPKLLLLIVVTFIIYSTGYSQTTADASGIAVQGIARDANNTARANESISLKLTIYFLNSSNNAENIFTENKTLDTDAFGVFSHVIQPGEVNYPQIANTEAYLKIEEGTTTISDEKLKHVPYAIAAHNGVPTGSIMPFIGTTAPAGWVLCDGTDISSVVGSAALIDLLGSNTVPDLRGTFLRGTGTSPTNGQSGPTLNSHQQENFKSHDHYINLNTSSQGNHNHGNGSYNQLLANDGTNTVPHLDNTTGEPKVTSSRSILPAGAHLHSVTGNTDARGDLETRPVNFGVNYIIKL